MRFKAVALAPAVAVIALAAAARLRSWPGESRAGAVRTAEIADPRCDPAGPPPEPDASRGNSAPAATGAAAPPPSGTIAASPGGRSRPAQRRGLRALEADPDPDARRILLAETLRTGDAGTKSRALSLLKILGGAEAAALAGGILQEDGPSWLRAQAASVLAGLGDPAALPFLLDASHSNDLDVRAAAASALDRLGRPAALHDLIATLAVRLDHPDGRIREDAVGLLSTLRSPAAVPTLAKALVDPTNSRIRESAADALGQIRRAEAIAFLEAALDDAEPEVRTAARRAIDAVRGPAAAPADPRP